MSEPSAGRSQLPDLHTLLTAQTVRAKIAAATPDEATEQVGWLLVATGSIEERYIEAMKRVLREMGPYAVIAPGIVLLHARPEDGVREPCLALATLAQPVSFGHSENDPVDVVFAFGAVNKHAHIAALQQLARLLMDEQVMQRIRAAEDDHTLLAVIQSWKEDAAKET